MVRVGWVTGFCFGFRIGDGDEGYVWCGLPLVKRRFKLDSSLMNREPICGFKIFLRPAHRIWDSERSRERYWFLEILSNSSFLRIIW